MLIFASCITFKLPKWMCWQINAFTLTIGIKDYFKEPFYRVPDLFCLIWGLGSLHTYIEVNALPNSPKAFWVIPPVYLHFIFEISSVTRFFFNFKLEKKNRFRNKLNFLSSSNLIFTQKCPLGPVHKSRQYLSFSY